MRAMRRPVVICGLCLWIFLLLPCCAATFINHYSPRNSQRPRRQRTYFIILHTTEGPKKGSLDKVYKNGETHYLVDERGVIYRIIHRRRIAFHAGRSMWNNRTELDDYSVGIELVGYHNRDISPAQYAALKYLLASLQRIYKVPDARVLTHSMVAYGAPNQWHRRAHRGRKRCGMQFASKSVRRRLGLDGEPLYDPDIRSGRLIAADPQLAAALYKGASQLRPAAHATHRLQTTSPPRASSTPSTSRSTSTSPEADNMISSTRTAWDIAGSRYCSKGTVYTLPDGKLLRGHEITNWNSIPQGTTVSFTTPHSSNSHDAGSNQLLTIGIHGDSAREIAGALHNSKTTIYFVPDGRVRQGNELNRTQLSALPKGTRVLVGYINGGYITDKRCVYDICGERWNQRSTYYRRPDKSIDTGDNIRDNAIPKGTMVFFKR